MANETVGIVLTEQILSDAAYICETVGRLSATDVSLPEGAEKKAILLSALTGTLSLTDLPVDGDTLAALPGSTEENGNKNLYEFYRTPERIDLSAEDALKSVHASIIGVNDGNAGKYRTLTLPIKDREGKTLRFGGFPNDVPRRMNLAQAAALDEQRNILLRACLFHYELEAVHPFADGNGRMARLWQYCLLCSWSKVFRVAPVEPVLAEDPEGYYSSLNSSIKKNNPTEFVSFMLRALRAALERLAQRSEPRTGTVKDSGPDREELVMGFLAEHPCIMNADLRGLCEISPATANRVFAKMCTEGKLVKVRIGAHYGYRQAEKK